MTKSVRKWEKGSKDMVSRMTKSRDCFLRKEIKGDATFDVTCHRCRRDAAALKNTLDKYNSVLVKEENRREMEKVHLSQILGTFKRQRIGVQDSTLPAINSNQGTHLEAADRSTSLEVLKSVRRKLQPSLPPQHQFKVTTSSDINNVFIDQIRRKLIQEHKEKRGWRSYEGKH